MDEQVYGVKQQFIEKLIDNMHAFGVSPTVGRVLGTIYMNREPMMLDELSAETGMSKMRMSQVVREMMELNIAERVFKPGIRKDLYQVEQDYYETFISLFTSTWKKAIKRNKQFEQKLMHSLKQIQEKQSELSAADEQLVNEYLEEAYEWMNYYDWIRRLIVHFESGEIFKYVPKKQEEFK
ncbi:GbsR/MarR family transcriptional regulator [Virgibacillus ihumii]|uniref:GbsR/MarR family transcriptional regulator n=1 Tax=Virgibacillus ihumii TaxID=2686091 RepID=UPI00157DF3DB|nr:GbsR/MarR family transcriptional regulator [Virgibacillus ihumii]